MEVKQAYILYILPTEMLWLRVQRAAKRRRKPSRVRIRRIMSPGWDLRDSLTRFLRAANGFLMDRAWVPGTPPDVYLFFD